MAFTPIAGKTGRVTYNSINLPFRDWSMNMRVDTIEADGFEKSAGADGNYQKSIVIGLAGGTVRITGRWNNAASEHYTGGTVLIRPGGSAGLYIGFTTTIGYTLTGKIVSINAGTKVAEGTDFDFEYFIESIAYTGQS